MRSLVLAGMALAFSLPSSAGAHSPLRRVVGFAPGGPADVVARIIAQQMMQDAPGQTVLVENRVGASGAIAGRHVAGAAKDSKTLLVTSTSQLVNQVLNRTAGYNIGADLIAVV